MGRDSRSPPVRVLQFVNSFYLGGTEQQVVELLRGLSGRFPPLVATANLRGPLLETLAELEIEPAEFSLRGGVGQVNTLRQVVRLARFMSAHHVRLVHAHDFFSAVLAVPAARLSGARAVVGRLDLGHWPSRAQKLMWAAVTRAADHVIANAEVIKQQLVDVERLPPARISVIPNGIDLARFDREMKAPLHAPLPELGGRVVAVHVANMAHPVKAQEDLLNAWRRVTASHPEAMLLLVGDGGRRAMIEELSSRLGLQRHVAFLGFRTDIPAILARAQLGVLCSSAEGLSNAVIEGMAAGLPMVVTHAGGNRELVRSGENGFVVPVKSPPRLAEKLSLLAGSPELRRTMGKASRAFVERELPIARLVTRHETVYRALLGERGGRDAAG